MDFANDLLDRLLNDMYLLGATAVARRPPSGTARSAAPTSGTGLAACLDAAFLGGIFFPGAADRFLDGLLVLGLDRRLVQGAGDSGNGSTCLGLRCGYFSLCWGGLDGGLLPAEALLGFDARTFLLLLKLGCLTRHQFRLPLRLLLA